MKSLTTLTTLFYFTAIEMKSLTTVTTLFTSLLLRWKLWLRSLRCFTSLLSKWNLWLRSLTLFYFTTINPRDRATIYQVFASRNFSVSIKFICARVVHRQEIQWGLTYFTIHIFYCSAKKNSILEVVFSLQTTFYC